MQDENTYIKIFRKMLNWGWYKDANTFRVFMHILLRVNYEPSEYMGHKVGAGECVFGRKTWAKELGLSEQQIRTAINHLKSTNEITIRSTNRFTIITVAKWEFWQIEEGNNNQQATNEKRQKREKRKKNNQQITNKEFDESVEILKKYGYEPKPINQQATNKQPTSNQQATTSKEYTTTIPSIEIVREYVAENNLKIDADYFYKYYETAGWKDLKGKPIKNWKLKALTWSRREERNNGTKNDFGRSTKKYAGMAESIPESEEKIFKFKEA